MTSSFQINVGQFLQELGVQPEIVSETERNRLLAHPVEMRVEEEGACIKVKLESGSWMNLHVFVDGRARTRNIAPSTAVAGQLSEEERCQLRVKDILSKATYEQICTMRRKQLESQEAGEGRGAFLLLPRIAEVRFKWMPAVWKYLASDVLVQPLAKAGDDAIFLLVKGRSKIWIFEIPNPPPYTSANSYPFSIDEKPRKYLTSCAYRCANCDAKSEKRLLHCGKCSSVYYCNSVCQGKHWKTHKIVCGDMALLEKERKIKLAARQ